MRQGCWRWKSLATGRLGGWGREEHGDEVNFMMWVARRREGKIGGDTCVAGQPKHEYEAVATGLRTMGMVKRSYGGQGGREEVGCTNLTRGLELVENFGDFVVSA